MVLTEQWCLILPLHVHPLLPLSDPSLPLMSSELGGTEDVEAERNPDPSLPEYQPPERGLPPPDYRDALQDVIVSSGPTVRVVFCTHKRLFSLAFLLRNMGLKNCWTPTIMIT